MTTRIDDVDENLKVAITYSNHDAYAAAARVGWPDALLDLKEALHELDVVNTFLLRRTREVHAADQLLLAIAAFLRDDRLTNAELVRAMAEYRELRGLVDNEGDV